MLRGTLEIHDIDVERLCTHVLLEQLGKKGASLRPHDFEDALAFLVAEAWRIGERYDPNLDKNPNFKSYCTRLLRGRLVEWYRHRWVDQRYTYGSVEQRDAIAFPDSLDRPAHDPDDETSNVYDFVAAPEAEPGELEWLVGCLKGNASAGGAADLARLLADRDRERTRDCARLRELAAELRRRRVA